MDIDAWTAASRAEQGLPPKASDPTLYLRMAELLGRR